MKKIITEWKKFLLNEESQFRDIIRIITGQRPTIHSVGIMTPENPKGKELSKKENDALLRQFEDKLKSMPIPIGYRRIRGKFENEERSFIIPNIARDEILQFGRDFEQEAVIWGSMQDGKMIYEYILCDTGETIQRRDVVLTGDKADFRSDYYSQEPGGSRMYTMAYPKGGPSAGPPVQRLSRKFVIPFFDSEYPFEPDNSEETEETEELDEVEHADLIKEMNERVSKILKKNITKKSRWHHRNVINERLKKALSKR